MSVTDTVSTTVGARPHPLDRLMASEIDAAREALIRAGLVVESTRFAYLGLEEPPKPEVLAYQPASPPDRRVRAFLLDTSSGVSHDVVVSIATGEVISDRTLDEADGQPPVLLEDFMSVDDIVKSSEEWRQAMARRGVTDLDLVCTCPLSAGTYQLPGEEGRRMLRVLSFLQHRKEDHPWAHPIDGVVAYIDLVDKQVIEVVDDKVMPIPHEEGNFDDAAATGPARTSLRPIEITQPDGPSFSVDGNVVEWENWRFRVGFDAREGLVLHELSFNDGGRQRPIIYRASVAEMVVPYGDPSPVRFWQNYFDAGEYLMGKWTNSLVLGCDCLGEIHYFDGWVADDHGQAQQITNAICMHEEDFGVLWKHTDVYTESSETRRQRRLVISFFITVGNYDYGFYWYLYLDGTIQLEAKATGVVFTSSYPGEGYRWATEVAPGLGAPFHQHLFSARLDMMVDGVENSVDEVEAVRVPMGPDNPYGNAFGRRATRLTTESEGQRCADKSAARVWHITNPTMTNRLGQPVAYVLYPQGEPRLLADPEASITRRARFATKDLWVTRYASDERYPSGDFVNQQPGLDGLPAFAAQDRDIDGQDIVLWHTFGLTHFPRPEDWPIMPVDYCGFTMKPNGFFDRNPTLDVPASPAGHCGGCE
ncbi:primary-amine oxidase [Leekyejoonella antrihumi]|uniref:Amine oxidase n=1 Tax=Leekyejoonella antrihumi TaxID=1660198 RepID=A0A563E242_9MICO|nr:primary-amine oxidase [Leekyejoonella antrihumi]TWP36596.1 primary-amine oxidase [Leekyejoonella antrihumi]